MIYLNRIILVFLMLTGLVFLPSCSNDQSGISSQKKKGLVVINVLKKELYDDCHIKGSISVPFEQVEQYVQEHIEKDAEIVFYCSNYRCSASGAACKKLQKIGFENVSVYEGGTAEWLQQGFPTNGPATSLYLTHKLEKPTYQNDEGVRIITTQELADKLKLKKES